MICFPNGKINLGLQVLSKRLDGFHNIESLFYPIPIQDALEFQVSDLFELTVSGLTIPGKTEENLLVKAYEAFSKKYGIPPLQVHLHKAIPFGSGLGGGSADASFFIRAMNAYFELETDELLLLARKLGSDCPFFIENKPSIVSGSGELIQTAQVDLSGKYLFIINPNMHVSTEKAYNLVQTGKPAMALTEIVSKPIERWKDLLVNDFEKPLGKLHPEILEIKKNFYQSGAVYASMTGSGAAVFGIYETKPNLRNINPNYYFWFGKL